MAQICYHCGKKAITGNLVSHAKNRVKRRFRPNLQTKWIMEKGKRVRVKLCTKCLKQMSQKKVSSASPEAAHAQA